MKYFLSILAVLAALASLCLFIAFIWILVTLGGGFNIVLPGLGLIISGSVLLAALFIFGLIMLAFTFWLIRKIYKPLR